VAWKFPSHTARIAAESRVGDATGTHCTHFQQQVRRRDSCPAPGTARALVTDVMPPTSILVPVDFSDYSQTALRFAARLAHHCGAQLHVLHAQAPLLEAAARARGIDLAQQTRAELTTFMQSAPPAGDWLPIHHVVSGLPVDVIGVEAARHQADLIVMGPRGLSRLQRTLLGSTSDGVVREAHTPVAIVPLSWVPAAPLTRDLEGTGPVVAGVEDPASAHGLLAAASALAVALQTDLQVVHAVADAGQAVAARQALASVLRAHDSQVATTLHVIVGKPATALLEFVSTPAAQRALLFLGPHSARAARDTRLDVLHLVATCRVPVVLGHA
jgi:nucleotide-binding universal stress UspA family protein